MQAAQAQEAGDKAEAEAGSLRIRLAHVRGAGCKAYLKTYPEAYPMDFSLASPFHLRAVLRALHQGLCFPTAPPCGGFLSLHFPVHCVLLIFPFFLFSRLHSIYAYTTFMMRCPPVPCCFSLGGWEHCYRV